VPRLELVEWQDGAVCSQTALQAFRAGAKNLSTIDEVPDSLVHEPHRRQTVTIDEIVRGPLAGPPPINSAGHLPEDSGAHPGMTARRKRGVNLEFDPSYNQMGRPPPW
jgi:hypothetical protein